MSTLKSMVNGRWSIAIQLWAIVYGLWTIISCSAHDPKFQQYYAQGQVLYEKHCSNCHQKNGTGLGLVYPPLAQSDYFKNNLDKSFCSIKYGIRGEIIVNGKNYNKPMPGIPSLTELEIAEVATYISNSWGSQREMVEILDVTSALKGCQPN